MRAGMEAQMRPFPARVVTEPLVDLDSGHWPQASYPDRLVEVVLDAAERVHRG